MNINWKDFSRIILIAGISSILTVGIYKFFEKDRLKVVYEQHQPIHLTDYKLPDGLVDFRLAAKIANPAVVHIKTRGSKSDYFSDINPFDFFGLPFERPFVPSEATGSGVILTSNGYIVTNNHVIDGGSEYEVTLYDNRKFEARLIGKDPSTDLAVLKVDAEGLPFLKFGDSDKVEVGEWCVAVGNPFNLTSTVTAGIISAKGRNINILNDKYKIESFIQTDAAVNPGNSGGALVTLTGELIGINTAIASRTGSYAGYSFAIPSRIVQKVVNDIIEFGKVQRGFLGVSIQDLNANLAKENNINRNKGVYIAGVNPGSGADQAGIKKGDVIFKINDVEVNNSAEMQEQIGRYRPGDKVKVTYLRDNKEYTVQVTLKDSHGSEKLSSANDKKSITNFKKELGADLRNLTSEEKNRFDLDGGVVVLNLVNGKLKQAGVREGFIIQKINKKPVKTVDDVMEALSENEGGILLEGRYPNGTKAFYAIGW
jgi:Do/DeqQ family serine protease